MYAQRCSKHNALVHDFFVSYRVSTDSINSEKLAAHLDGKKRPDGDNFVTYLDKNCLIQGKDWEAGFTYGINHSSAILLLISEGLIKTMVYKAKRGEVDNVLKEHQIALELLHAGRLVIPVYVASLTVTKERRDCYIKLNRDAMLRQFDIVEDDPAVRERLQAVKHVLEQLFQLPSVNILPDAIAEQVPKILQMWYAEFVRKKSKGTNLGSLISATKEAVLEPSRFRSWILYPSQSFRLVFVGMLIGFFGVLASLSLLFMPSKSKRHTDLKTGVALGNIIGFLFVIAICIYYCADYFYVNNNVYCTSCESVVLDYSNASYAYAEKIPGLHNYFNYCISTGCSQGAEPANLSECLGCACGAVYQKCEQDYALGVTLLLVIAVQVLLIVGTSVISSRFTKMESFSMSIMQ